MERRNKILVEHLGRWMSRGLEVASPAGFSFYD
jgi:hypothetical protein